MSMELRHQHVRIVARVTYKRGAFHIALEVCFIQTKQELRWVIMLVENGCPISPLRYRHSRSSCGLRALRNSAVLVWVRKIDRCRPYRLPQIGRRLATPPRPPPKDVGESSMSRNRRDLPPDRACTRIAHRPEKTAARETSEHTLRDQEMHRS